MQKSTKYPELDGVRGLAIILVIGYHFGSIIPWGWMGVDLFFVLSGFLISLTLSKQKLNVKSVEVYLRNRALRIFPLYYILLVFFFLALPVLGLVKDSAAFEQLVQNQWYFWTFQQDIWYSISGWPSIIFLVPLWSLGVEVKFYLLWPIVLLLMRKLDLIGKLFLFFLIGLFSVLFRFYGNTWLDLESNYRYVFFISRLDSFVIGGAIFLILEQRPSLLNNKWWMGWGIVVVLWLIGLFLFGNWDGGFSNPSIALGGFSLIATGWACMIVLSFRKYHMVSKLFRYNWLRWLGKHSYGMYLFHYPVWLLVNPIVPNMLLRIIIAISGTLLIGYLSFELIEKKFLSLKNNPE